MEYLKQCSIPPDKRVRNRLKTALSKTLKEGKTLASTHEEVQSSTQTKGKSRSDTPSLMEFAEQDWSESTILTGRKEKRMISDSGELYVEETGDQHDTDSEYIVQHREGRFGPSTRVTYGESNGEFDDFNEAEQYAQNLTQGQITE